MAIQPTDINVTIEQLCNGIPPLAIGGKEKYAYDTENRQYTDKRDGTNVEVVLPGKSYEKIWVHIPTTEFDGVFSPEKPLKISFSGFVGKFFKDYRTNEYYFSAKAEGVTILK